VKGGDISNLSSPQVTVLAEVIAALDDEKGTGIFSRKTVKKVGNINTLAANRLWKLANDYGVSLELAGYEEDGWTEELLEKLMSKLEHRVVNPFNYAELYENVDDLVGLIPYRANLRGVVDIPGRVARYGSAGVELENL
jgi:hypothetical protein